MVVFNSSLWRDKKCSTISSLLRRDCHLHRARAWHTAHKLFYPRITILFIHLHSIVKLTTQFRPSQNAWTMILGRGPTSWQDQSFWPVLHQRIFTRGLNCPFKMGLDNFIWDYATNPLAERSTMSNTPNWKKTIHDVNNRFVAVQCLLETIIFVHGTHPRPWRNSTADLPRRSHQTRTHDVSGEIRRGQVIQILLGIKRFDALPRSRYSSR